VCCCAPSSSSSFGLRDAQVKRTNPPAFRRRRVHHIVEVTGRTDDLYLGPDCYDKDGKIVGAGDMKAQAEQVFKNLEAALAAAGAKFPRREDEQLHHRHVEGAGGPRRARAAFQGCDAGEHVRRSESLVRPELLLEIEVVAVVPPGRESSSFPSSSSSVDEWLSVRMLPSINMERTTRSNCSPAPSNC